MKRIALLGLCSASIFSFTLISLHFHFSEDGEGLFERLVAKVDARIDERIRQIVAAEMDRRDARLELRLAQLAQREADVSQREQELVRTEDQPVSKVLPESTPSLPTLASLEPPASSRRSPQAVDAAIDAILQDLAYLKGTVMTAEDAERLTEHFEEIAKGTFESPDPEDQKLLRVQQDTSFSRALGEISEEEAADRIEHVEKVRRGEYESNDPKKRKLLRIIQDLEYQRSEGKMDRAEADSEIAKFRKQLEELDG